MIATTLASREATRQEDRAIRAYVLASQLASEITAACARADALARLDASLALMSGEGSPKKVSW